MTTHFLFQEGEWIGEGKVFVAESTEVIPFQIRWTVAPIDKQRFRAVQRVEIVDQETMVNVFTITRQLSGEFQVFLENEVLGVFSGEGVSDDQSLAWEFAHYGALEGLEVYERTKNSEYVFRAEYLGNDGSATTVQGNIESVA